MPKSKRGIYLAVIGLVIGLLIGITIQIVEHQVANEVELLLAEEVESACDCKLEIESIALSLTTLKASATNARINKGGQTRISIPYLTVDASIRDIFARTITLDSIALYDANIDGFDEESALYLFIEHLTTPSEKQGSSEPKVKIRLDQLSVHNATLFEDIDDVRVKASDVSLKVQNTLSDDFLLTPVIGSLEILKVEEEQEPRLIVSLGEVTGRVLLEDRFAYFQEILSKMPESKLLINATSASSQANKLDGQIELELASPSFDLDQYVSATLQGQGTISGTLGRPKLSIDLLEAPNSSVSSPPDSLKLFSFDDLNADLDVEVQDNNYLVEVKNLNASAPGQSLKLSSPITITKDGLSGTGTFTAQNITTPEFELERAQLDIDLGGTIGTPSVALSLVAHKLIAAGMTFSNLNARAKINEDNIEGNATATPGNGGKANLNFSLTRDSEQRLILESSMLSIEQMIVHSIAGKEGTDADYTVSGNLKLTGPLDPNLLVGNGELNLLLPEQASIKALIGIKDGQATISDQSELIELSGSAQLTSPNKIKLKLDTESFSFLDEELECASIALNLDYTPGESFIAGSGLLNIDSLAFGCNRFRIELANATRYPIEAGTLTLPKTVFRGTSGEFHLQGKIDLAEGPDLKAVGAINLANLLPFIDGVDDLRGELESDARLFGTFEQPLISGVVSLVDATVSVESAGIMASEISGTVQLDQDHLETSDLQGILNSGSFNINGTIFPDRIADSTIRFRFEDLFFEPTTEMNITLSGDISLATGETGKGILGGSISVDQAEFERNIEITTILREIPRMIFSPGEDSRQEDLELPDIEVDLTIKASRNVFIITSYLGAELRGDFELVGTLANPNLDGQLEIITGWFGIRGRRFEITSGIITFQQPGNVPYLSLTSETYARTQTGENILIFLEATGPAEDPRISFTSDRGLSQQELLALVSSVDNDYSQSFGQPGFDSLTLNDTAEKDKQWFGLQGFFRKLTTLDSVSIEPKTNPFRGQIEPTVIARKSLPFGVNLIGENYLNSDDARLIGQYYLTESLKVEGILESLPNEDQDAIGADLTYTVIAKQAPFAEIEFTGISRFREKALSRSLRLSQYSRIPTDELPQLKERVQQYFLSRGYLNSESEVKCLKDNEYCRHLEIRIIEGTRFNIDQILLEGAELPKEIEQRLRDGTSTTVDQYATTENKDSLINDLIGVLRNEGYISTRIEGEYLEREDQQAERVTLSLSVNIGRPTSFIFKGNTKFTPEEFLKTINLFERKQPFGNNTIRILVENIGQLYRDQGYREVTVEYERSDSGEDDRIFYEVLIEEGAQSKVAEVQFELRPNLTHEELDSFIKEFGEEETVDRILNPPFPVREDLRNNIRALREILIAAGYPNPTVDSRIDESDQSDQVNIVYEIDPGEQILLENLTLIDFPDDLVPPDAPKEPTTIPRINRYVRQIINSLKSAGYRSPRVWTESRDEELRIVVAPGDLTRIEEIEITGNVQTDQDVILAQLGFAADDPWSLNKIDQARRSLLQLGLFQRVEIEEKAGSNPLSKQLILRVDEKPLQTLEVGAGLNSEFGLHAFGEATDREFFKDGRALSFRFDGYFDETSQEVTRGSAGFRFLHPNLFKTKNTYATDLRYEKFDLSSREFNLDRASFAHSVYRSLDNGITYSLGYTFMRDDLSNVTPGAILTPLDTGIVNLGFLSGSISYDRRDDPLVPRKGFFLSSNYQLSSKALGSDADFLGVGGRLSWTVPFSLGEYDFALANNSRGALAWTFRNTDQVPITQRYYLGGRTTVRGFREDSLGPEGPDSAIIGGDLLLQNNLEFRHFLSQNFSTHIFYDTGSVFLRDRDVDLDDLRHSAGVGLRYLSPIGPIGFDVGAPLDERDGEPSMRFHFVIGSVF